jgi:predicted transcriptional regulator
MREDTAVSSLPRGAPQRMIDQMITKLVSEREQVRTMIKDEVEALMQLGAEVTKMTYMCKNTDAERLCITP